MSKLSWKEGVIAGPAVGVSLLPKFVCPLCSPAYAALLSSLGLGFLVSTTYLLPLTFVFLSLAIGALGLSRFVPAGTRAALDRRRRGRERSGRKILVRFVGADKHGGGAPRLRLRLERSATAIKRQSLSCVPSDRNRLHEVKAV